MLVVLTGSNSFIGGHVLRHLLDAGHEVIATSRSAPQNPLSSRDCRCVSLDLGDPAHYARVLPERADAIVHIAGISGTNATSINDILRCNVTGTSLLAQYAVRAGAKTFVHASTLSIHGRIEVDVVDEHTPSIAPGTYGASKLLGERILAEIGRSMAVLALRLPGTLGRGAHRAWIPTIVQHLLAQAPVKIYNPSAPFNNAAHVDDIGRLVIRTIAATWGGFHALPIGAAGTIPVRDVVGILRRELGSESCIIEDSEQKPGFTISSSTAMQRFGYAPMQISDMLVLYASETLGRKSRA
jgi:nucleoside-diphosphate-sugar epimerase